MSDSFCFALSVSFLSEKIAPARHIWRVKYRLSLLRLVCKKERRENKKPQIDFCFKKKTGQLMLMYGKVSQENYVELTAASAIPNKEIKSPQILRY